MQLCSSFEHSLTLPLFGIGMKTDPFQSCGHYWVVQICWFIECSTFTASSFRTWNSPPGIPSPPLAWFIVVSYDPFYICGICFIKKRWQEYTEELYKKDLHDQDNHNGVITHPEPDILECEVKWALGSITMNKASGGDGIPGGLFQVLKDDAVKVLHSINQQIWTTQ